MTSLLLAVSVVLYVVSLPPFGLWGGVFLVPAVWTVLVLRAGPPASVSVAQNTQTNSAVSTEKQVRQRIYLPVWVASFVFWLCTIYWISFPHWMTGVGLIALAGYLAWYWVLFIWLTRKAVFQWNVPIWFAMPIIWCACEFLRKHLLDGFSFCSLEHALYRQPVLLPLAQYGGEYLVGAAIVFFGSVLGCILCELCVSVVNISVEEKKHNIAILFGTWRQLVGMGILATLFIGGTVFTGKVRWDDHRDRDSDRSGDGLPFRVAMLQGNFPASLTPRPGLYEDTFQQYVELTDRVVQESREAGKPVNLVIWPETVCPFPFITVDNFDENESVPVEWSSFFGTDDNSTFSEERRREFLHRSVAETHAMFVFFAKTMDTAILFGVSRLSFQSGKPEPVRYNTALLVTPDEIGGYYDKMQRVLFGEYIPFADWLPDDFPLKSLCPQAGAGTEPVWFPLGTPNGDTMLVNICFESTIPHLIRRQLLSPNNLTDGGPTFLVNMSNDGWFRYSNQMELHLATHVFRAVESGRPYLVATNCGYAAWIDSSGTILASGVPGEATYCIAEIPTAASMTGTRGNTFTFYTKWGDWLPLGCLVFVVFQFSCRWIYCKIEKKSPVESHV